MEEDMGSYSPEPDSGDEDDQAQSSARDQWQPPRQQIPTATDTPSSYIDDKHRETCSSTNYVLQAPRHSQFTIPAILRFRKESHDQLTDSLTVQSQPQHMEDTHATCEFCKHPTKPFPSLAVLQNTAEPEEFCCAQAQSLIASLAIEWKLLLDTLDQGYGGTSNAAHSPSQVEELKHKAWEEEHRQQERDLEQYYQASHSADAPGDTYTPQTRTISFQLSNSVLKEVGKTVIGDSASKQDLQQREKELLTGPGVFGFGIAHHKDNIRFREKYYSNGKKFLTVFPDGSAQVLYPSGQLAILITTGGNKAEMVCIVQDDQSTDPPIQALFQSNGRATCYHRNGKIWVSMDIFGGQCLDETGARVRRWRWGGHLNTPTPLRPLFLSLNQSIGVRILGQDRMFVTFLSKGCKARFSVGTFAQFKDASVAVPPSGPSICREEATLLAGRIGLHRALGRLHHCIRFSSNPQPPVTRLPDSLLSLARALLELSQGLDMEERDRTFIQTCLQDCL
ncbi:hypothetical protein AGOR_G00241650 [Albula goreensis]|uniref:FAM194 C-terminal domain-containing protein n=1 Tax=Albula goreensis TaxID=1534307 RepID=A0A8T3CDK9_9TELE|nr:hypothetical protein AGOR_G00241650 [Albula goreensis]